MILALLLAFSPAALTYVESSQGLVDAPAWESGNSEVELADVDGDGQIDLVSVGDHGNPLIGSGEQGIMIWHGDGHGGWSYRRAGNLGYGGVAVGDVNGDGTPDLAYGIHHNYAASDLGDQLLEAVLGDGSGTVWTPWDDGLASDGQGYGMFATDLADLDGDGALDIASIGFGAIDGLHVYLNRKSGAWRRSFGFLAGNSGNVLATGDVDGDGFPDLGAAKQEASVWLGDGDGFFAAADGTLPAPGEWNYRDGTALGDVDGDGHDDLAWCDLSAIPQVWLWRAGNAWVSGSAGLPADGRCRLAALADMDGDGRVDLVTLGSGRVRVFAGNGAGTAWTAVADFATGDTPGEANALRVGGDVDHNGRPDIVTVDTRKTGTFTVQNKVRCWREASTPAALSVRVVRPGPNRTLLAGSVAFVEWTAAVPAGPGARVAIELSTAGPGGPFVPIATELPDSGRYQWTVPPRLSGDCRLRVTVTAGASQAGAVGPRFTIAPRPDRMALGFDDRQTLRFVDALARDRHDLYRSDWTRFLATGEYTQDPAAEAHAARFCGLAGSTVDDPFLPSPGTMVFYLATAYRLVEDGQAPGVKVPLAESPLGQDAAARMRPNAHRCP